MAATGYTSGDPTKMAKAANLGDVAAAAASRTNLGLGNSATRDVGTTAGTVAAGDDSRFSGGGGGAVDSVNGQTGVVVLGASDVGAAATSHTHAAADVVSGTLAVGRIPTGQTGSTVPFGNDARFTDARTPTAHASTHASAGSDPVTVAQSQVTGLAASLAGKSDVGHVHAGADITSGTVAYARLPVGTGASTVAAGDDSRITGAAQKSANLSDLGSAATARTNLGLGTAAVVDTGIGSANAILGNDARLTDARTPTAHVHAGADITTGTVAYARLPVGTGSSTVAAGNDSRITGALQAANNLSDVATPATARTNLGLGTAAIKDTGTGSGNVILGNDSRLTDSRTPTTHASTHASAGSDPVTLAESQVTGLVSDLAGKQPLDSDLTDIAALTPTNDDIVQRKAGAWTNRTIAQLKTDLAYTAGGLGALVAANNLSDVANTGTSRTNLGLGDSATKNVGTSAGTVSAGDDSRITGAAQKANNLSDLASASTARTNLGLGGAAVLAVGTTAGTVAAGDDSRITGAVQKSVGTTKGDLLVATGASTIVRHGVGSDGQSLIADSAQTNGVKWAIAPGIPAAVVPRAAYTQVGGATTARTSKAVTLNALYIIPYGQQLDATLSSISFELTSSTATAVARLGAFSIASPYTTATLITDFGTFTADTTGKRQCAVSQAMTAGVNAIGVVFQTAAPNLRFGTGFNPFVSFASEPTGSGLGANTSYVITSVSGALAGPYTLTSDSDCPIVWAKF